MAEHGPQTFELVEVKAEDIMSERQALYDRFMTATTWSIGLTVGVLVLMWIFLV
jgi:hypothetical protein